MARVYRFHEYGGPEVLRLEDIPLAALDADDVHVKIKTIGLNRADSTFRSNTYIKKATLPSRLGYEAAGVVMAVGKKVTRYSSGDAVCILPPDDLGKYGIYADEMVIPQRLLVHKPANLSWEEASSVWMQFLTAWGGIVSAGDVKKGDHVLITAASTSVGLAAIQVASFLGAVPIAAVGSDKWSDLLMKTGAAHIIVEEKEDLLVRLIEIAGQDGLSVAFDAVGGANVEVMARALKKFGCIVIHGFMSTEPTIFPIKLAIRKSLTIKGYLVLELFNNAELFEKGKEFIVTGLASGALTPCIDKVFPFEEMREAQEYMESDRRYGKVVVRVDG